MLKIPKGLKKKKKGKKSKRKGEEELFTEEELEKYRREHQAQAPQAQAPQAETQEYSEQDSSERPKSDNDEWSKFNALTTGVDSILKKTQGDLDRIKSTSFFQRKPAGPVSVDQCGKNLPLKRDAVKDGQKWIGFEEKEEKRENCPEVRKEEPIKAEDISQVSSVVLSETESEEEYDDIFDTSYVEDVEKGKLTLVYVPDSPEQEVDEGPDPFDTSYADKIIKGPEVSKKGKRLVNIGVAVEVLTGRLDNVTPSTASIKKAKRRVPRDLLLEIADSEDVEEPAEETAKVKSLLDDDPDITEDIPTDLSVSLHTQFIKQVNNAPKTADVKHNDILNTFDTLKAGNEDDDEFAQIASESLNKPTATESSIVIPVLPTEPVVEDCGWAAFEESKPKPSRPPPPRPASGPNQLKNEVTLNSAVDSNSPEDFDEGPDPFDTTFAENILPGKAELKNLEEELLNSNTSQLPNSDSDFDFNPREGEKPYINNRRRSSVHIHITDPTGIRESISDFESGDVTNFETLKPVHRDLLGGSSTDLSQLADSPIAPSTSTDTETIDYSDPFDTSIVNFITAPGKTELKFIEQELLGESELKKSLSDPDFDPRADENEETFKNSSRKPSRPENLLVNKTVLFKIPAESAELLEVEKGSKKKPVTPYYAREASITDEEVDTQEDLFDDSSVEPNHSVIKPAGSILKKASDAIQLTRSSSDQDLNSDEEFVNEKSFSQLRRHSDFPANFAKVADLSALERRAKQRTDFLSISEEESVDIKVLTPYQEKTESFDVDIDPFDTSVVNNILLPGKTELKVLENELLSKESVSDLCDSNFDPRSGETTKKQVQDLLEPSDDVFQVKALTPEIPEPATGFLIGTEDDDIDPFDTSIADNLAPGKTELKILESELMN